MNCPQTETHEVRDIVSGNKYIVNGKDYIVNDLLESIHEVVHFVSGKDYIVNDLLESINDLSGSDRGDFDSVTGGLLIDER